MEIWERSRKYGKKIMSATLLYQAIMGAKDGSRIFIPSVLGADRIITVNVKERNNEQT